VAAGRLLDLAKTGWLSQQPPEFQARMAMIGRWSTIRRGTMHYSVGDESIAIYGLGEGLLDIAIPVNSEREVVVHRATAGFWIGDSGVLADSARTMSVSVPVDSRVFVLPTAAILRDLETCPADWACFCKLSHMNASMCLKVLAEIISLPARVRFARTLLRLTSPSGAVHATQEELGRMVGMSRAAFRRACATLIELGILEVEYGGIRVRDRTALEIEANK
jgi:CRP/FNR family transcriptional regulator, cyclic AMP receptor protein